MKFTIIKTAIFTLSFLFVTSGFVYAAQLEGVLRWSKRVAVSTPVNGIIEKVIADVGDKVKKGDALLNIEQTVFKARVSGAGAEAKNRVEEYKEAMRELERMQELYDRTMLSEHDLQVAKNALVRARAEKEKARARYVEAKYDLKYSTVHAPFDAIVLERHAQPGQVIATDLKPETLFVLAEANRMLARILVDEKWLSKLHKGQKINLTVSARDYSGVLRVIALEPVTGSNGKSGYPVDIEFEYSGGLLRAGQKVKVDIK